MSHETIYQCLFVRTKGTLERDLTGHLRDRLNRRPQKGTEPRVRFKITEDITISARPAEADDQACRGTGRAT